MNPVINILRKNKAKIENSFSQIPYKPLYRFKVFEVGDSIIENVDLKFSWLIDGKEVKQRLSKITDRSVHTGSILPTKSSYGPIVYEAVKVKFTSTVIAEDNLFELLLNNYPELQVNEETELELNFLLLITYQYLLNIDKGTIAISFKNHILSISSHGYELDLSRLDKYEFGLFPHYILYSLRKNGKEEVYSKKLR
jgi:hypothetical protein